MKKSSLKHFIPLVVGLAFGGLTVQAAQLNGEITFNGLALLNDSLASASAYTSILGPGGPGTSPVVTAAIGDFGGIAVDTEVNFTAFTFNPAPASSFLLWSFTYNATPYSFEVTSVSSEQNSGFLHVYGAGIARVGNFDPTPATWSFTDNGNPSYFNFGAAIIAVPEPTASVLIIAFGFVAAVTRRGRSGR
jgi:hypothetical protein